MSHSVHTPPRHCNALIGIAIGLAHLPLHHELLRKSARYQEASQQPEENFRKMRRLVDGEKTGSSVENCSKNVGWCFLAHGWCPAVGSLLVSSKKMVQPQGLSTQPLSPLQIGVVNSSAIKCLMIPSDGLLSWPWQPVVVREAPGFLPSHS